LLSFAASSPLCAFSLDARGAIFARWLGQCHVPPPFSRRRASLPVVATARFGSFTFPPLGVTREAPEGTGTPGIVLSPAPASAVVVIVLAVPPIGVAWWWRIVTIPRHTLAVHDPQMPPDGSWPRGRTAVST